VAFKRLVSQHVTKIRSVAEYAKMLAISPQRLQKIIRRETGKSPGQLIDEMVILEIKALLRYSDISIAEIAWQLDFTDPSHLSRFFRKHTTLTPLAWRNEAKQVN
jgi:AraC-like DNA-binding protein